VRRRRSLLLTWIAVVLLAAPLSAASASGMDLQPLNLRVDGGEETWHAEPGFGLSWRNPPQAGSPEIAAVHYRLLDPAGQVALPETRIDWAATSIDWLRVPDTPAAYTVEVWLENSLGAKGTPATARLRFDDVRPGHVDPLPSPGWIGRGAFPYSLRLGRPAGPDPISGIRGYAVSIDPNPGGSPCASVDRCSEAETACTVARRATR
jgi:hypothetical protein